MKENGPQNPSALRHDGIQVRVLGPLQLHLDGDDVALGGPQQRLVLALLVAAGPFPSRPSSWSSRIDR